MKIEVERKPQINGRLENQKMYFFEILKLKHVLAQSSKRK
jgi:hypothetical protein